MAGLPLCSRFYRSQPWHRWWLSAVVPVLSSWRINTSCVSSCHLGPPYRPNSTASVIGCVIWQHVFLFGLKRFLLSSAKTVQDTGFFLWVKCDTGRASFFLFGSPLWPVPWKQKLKWNMWEKFSPIPIALGSLVEENTRGAPTSSAWSGVRVRCFVHYVRLKESSVSVHVCVCLPGVSTSVCRNWFATVIKLMRYKNVIMPEG